MGHLWDITEDRPFGRWSNEPPVRSNFGLSKSMVVERSFEMSKLTVVNRNFGPSKIMIVDPILDCLKLWLGQ